MSSDKDICKECGAIGSIITDCHGGHEQLVCQDCGCVFNQTMFASQPQDDRGWVSVPEANHFARFNAPQSLRHGEKNAETLGQQSGLKKIRCICSTLSLPSELCDEAKEMFRRVNVFYKRTSVLLREQLAACCVYLVCRLHRNTYPFTAHQFLKMVSWSDPHFTKHLMDIKRQLHLDVPLLSLDQIVASICERAQMSNEENIMTCELAELVKTMWKSNGPRDEAVVLSCAFLVWQSSKFAERYKYKLPDFIKKFSFTPVTRMGCIVKTISNWLCEIAGKLPWLDTKVDPKRISYYLKSILSHQHCLLDKSMQGARDYCRVKSKADDSPSATSAVRYDLDDPDLTNDLSESEVKEYLRTDEEVIAWTKAQEKFEGDDADD